LKRQLKTWTLDALRVAKNVVKIELERRQRKRAEDEDTPNKSLDVRAKQRLCLERRLLPLACVDSVSPHVNSVVGRFVVAKKMRLVNDDD
jgi:hypothetical protein